MQLSKCKGIANHSDEHKLKMWKKQKTRRQNIPCTLVIDGDREL